MKLPKEYIHSQHCFLLYLHSGRKSEATLQSERDVKKCEELNLFCVMEMIQAHIMIMKDYMQNIFMIKKKKYIYQDK